MTGIKKIIVSLMAFAMVAVVMAVSLPLGSLHADAKVTEADIQAVKDKIKNNEKKIKEYQSSISSLGSEIEKAMEAKALLDQQINSIQDNIDDTAGLIDKYEIMIAEKEAQIAQRESELDKKYSNFLEQLRISYEDGNQNYLELLVSSKNLFEFITRLDNLGSVLDYERNLMEDMEKEVGDLNKMKQSLVEKKDEYKQLGQYQSDSYAQLETKLKESEALIKKLEKDKTAAEKAYNNSVKQDAALDKELDNLIKEYEKQQTAAAKGALLWPVDPNYRDISSPYGDRILWGKKDFHLGIDIPVPYGKNIYAANDGTVLKATYNDSYGYYIVISHGGNISTCYAHCSKLLVKAGQKVTRGQIIAKIGSTGSSSGYHLHFEVRNNGKVTNPLVKGMLVILNNGKYVDPVEKKLLDIWD